MTNYLFKSTLKLLPGLILLMPVGIVFADNDGRRAICPCYTTEMINMLFVSAAGFQHDEGDSRPDETGLPDREPMLANEFFVCEPPSGPQNLEVEIFFHPPGPDDPAIGVGVGILGLDDSGEGAGTCAVITTDKATDEDFFLFSVGAEPNLLIVGAEGISRREMRACKRAILRSLIWRTFCPTEPEQD